jgi:ATP-binding cassette, subfamily B, heavy metal transporter
VFQIRDMLKTLRTFYKYAAENRLLFGSFIMASITADILFNLTPYFYKLFIDNIPGSDFAVLFKILLGYIGVRALAIFFDELRFYLADLDIGRSSSKVRMDIFKHVQDLDFAFHSNKSTGSLISIFKRGDSAFFSIFDTLHPRLLDVVVGIAVMIFFFVTLDYRISLISLASFLTTLLVARGLIGLNLAKRKVFNDEEDNISEVITDNLINFETVKLFAREKWEQDKLAKRFVNWRSAFQNFANTFRVLDTTIGSIILGTLFVTFSFALSQVTSLKIEIGDFVMIAAFTSAFFPKLWDLVWGLRDISKHYIDVEKYFGLLDEEIEVKDPINPAKVDKLEGEINFKNIHFTYGGRSKNAINGINLKVEKGQSVALVGRSGSGKTTMAKLLMRFYDLDSGQITVDGIDIKKFTKSNLRSFVGVVPQEPILFNNTVAYNIGYGKDNPSLKSIKAASRLANIDTFIEGLKEKYDTHVGERGMKLSGGQKQRLAIARMILSDPDIVVFDEATSHLDSESEKLIQDAFWKARDGKTTLIIAHRLSTIMRADKIVVMDKGKIAETGTHLDLLGNTDGIYKHLWDLQVNKS